MIAQQLNFLSSLLVQGALFTAQRRVLLDTFADPENIEIGSEVRNLLLYADTFPEVINVTLLPRSGDGASLCLGTSANQTKRCVLRVVSGGVEVCRIPAGVTGRLTYIGGAWTVEMSSLSEYDEREGGPWSVPLYPTIYGGGPYAITNVGGGYFGSSARASVHVAGANIGGGPVGIAGVVRDGEGTLQATPQKSASPESWQYCFAVLSGGNE
jgi:hypothetical protein